jgi:hypothetical protein
MNNLERIKARGITVPRLDRVDGLLADHKEYQAHSPSNVQSGLKHLKAEFPHYVSDYIDLSEFGFMYPVNGITDALNMIATRGENVGMRGGDYEWLRFLQPPALGKVINRWYETYPSAIDGNYKPEHITSYASQFAASTLDCAYIGASKRPHSPLKPPANTTDVLFSASKMFGIPEMRMGLWFSRTPVQLMEGLMQSGYFRHDNVAAWNQIMQWLPVNIMYRTYEEQQQSVCQRERFTPSDVVFMATTDDPKYDHLKRGSTNRICLTEHFKCL